MSVCPDWSNVLLPSYCLSLHKFTYFDSFLRSGLHGPVRLDSRSEADPSSGLFDFCGDFLFSCLFLLTRVRLLPRIVLPPFSASLTILRISEDEPKPTELVSLS